jgi:hypothetical protein
MPTKDIDGGLTFQGYNPAILKGVKAIPKDTYSSVPFYFGGANIRSYIKPNVVATKNK